VERPVKERLVGAAVLMAAAVILIPEMLSGPDRGATGKSVEAGGIKTYTIDLSQSPGVTTATSGQTTDNRAPPPETISSTSAPLAGEFAPEPADQISPESSTPAVAETPAERSPAPAAEPPPQPETTAPAQPQPKPQAKPEAPSRPVASGPTAPTSSAPAAKPAGNAAPADRAIPAGKGWAVQLGSYSSEATAQRLSGEWRARGQNAFVMPVKSGGKTLYRVRLGPTKDRDGAEALLKSVKASVPGAAVVMHP